MDEAVFIEWLRILKRLCSEYAGNRTYHADNFFRELSDDDINRIEALLKKREDTNNVNKLVQ